MLEFVNGEYKDMQRHTKKYKDIQTFKNIHTKKYRYTKT